MRALVSRKNLFLLFSLCWLTLSLLGVGTAYWFQYPQQNKGTIVLIEKGSSLTQISNLLHQEGVLNFPLLFKAVIYGTRSWAELKAGEYWIPANITPSQLIYILKKGEVILHPVTLIEGETSHTFTQKLIADNHFQGAIEIPPEGSLLPETYYFPRGTEREKIIKHIQKAMKEKLTESWAQRLPDFPLTSPEELVVLASIVEKETAHHEEKPVIAAVFLNRLHQGMPLQADPTVHYSLTEGKGDLGRDLTHEDLNIPSSYNTYLNIGLPPSPITNPSLSSLKAALSPAKVPYLYFVANGCGKHTFSTNLEEHQKNCIHWQRVKKEVKENKKSPLE